ncbi:hypothetical protein [Chromatium okenii]|jgi:hypothetical protein|uniref:hypothetical protein n=1 Tax=Chromatium okenii TaxID=61644 RepID=UPI0026EB2D3F|nr:hypothetical protein [Chromatium okenii]MBV5310831.1 hypothetical protein [Chromatium okenii]
MTLFELINSTPALYEYARTGNDGAIQQWLNTPSIVSSRKIPINEFVACLYDTGAFTAIKQAAVNNNATATFAIETMKDCKALGVESIDLSLIVNQDLLNGLLVQTIITQEQVDAVAALAVTLVSPAEANGLGAVSLADVAEWRLLHG